MAKKNPTTDVTIITDTVELLPELQTVINQSQLPVSKAQAHAMQLAPFMAKINELTEPLATMDKVNPTPEMAKQAREARLKMVPNRTDAARKKDELKSDLLIEGNLIDGLFKVIENASKLTESEYAQIEKFEENRLNALKAVLKTTRLTLLEPFEVPGLEYFQLDVMPEDQFQNLLANSKTSFEQRNAAKIQAEKDRIEAEKLAEENRIKAEKEQAAENERIRLENIRLKEEQDKKEAISQRGREWQGKLIAAGLVYGGQSFGYKDTTVTVQDIVSKSDKDLQKIVDTVTKQVAKDKAEAEKEAIKNKVEQDKKDLAARQLAEQNAALQAELKAKQDESDRLERERLAAEKSAKSAPDKDKINALYTSIKALMTLPELNTPEYKAIGMVAVRGLQGVLDQIKIESNKLK